MRGLPSSEPRSQKLARIGTLNVGSFTGKSREVDDLMRRRNIQVFCLQETQWKGEKAREVREDVRLYYNGDDTKQNGVAIVMVESLKKSVSAVNKVIKRIPTVRIGTKEGYWKITSV
uniref:Endonuclease exonuclease phosphatase domain containing protein n=1 Tax=Haemonchus contortus TaxID=6289 RepID=A0A7I4YIF9_HAECO